MALAMYKINPQRFNTPVATWYKLRVVGYYLRTAAGR